MFLTSAVFCIHFLYFSGLKEVFPYFESILALLGLLIFPMYHIYFRLLTVDKQFSFKKHYPIFLVPAFFFVIYSAAILATPWNQYINWLFNNVNESLNTRILQVIRNAIRLVFLSQLIMVLFFNYRLLKKYGHEAAKFYSDTNDAENRFIKQMNYSFIVIGFSSTAAILLGRFFLFPEDIIMKLIWIMFSVTLFIMGNLGSRLKLINPSINYSIITDVDETEMMEEIQDLESALDLTEKISREFTVRKAYLNTDLNIIELANKLGTNRTYISLLINRKYNQNFCSFVNAFRVDELEKAFLTKPDLVYEEYAILCGFGSVSSMKRAVKVKTGMAFSDFKQSVQNKTKVAV